MIIVVDPGSGVPVYRQIIDQIRFQTSSGRLKPGDELPSTRALSANLGVNPMTVSKAYAFLEQEGVLLRRPGLPLVVADLSADTLAAGRRARLREDLLPVITRLRQLGVPDAEARTVFDQLLTEHPADLEDPS